MAPGLGEIEPVTLRVGSEHDFDTLVERLVELAYARVDMVGKRGEFAVRGGILDVFPPTADHPVRVEFWGDEVTELRPFSVADQRSITDVEVPTVIATPCRELLLTETVKERAAQLAKDNPADASLVEMLDKMAGGIPVEGMEALLPVLQPGELQLLTDVLPSGTHVLLCDPEKVRTRATDLMRTGQEFLEASWTAASIGGAAPLDASNLKGVDGKPMDLAASAYRSLRQVRETAQAGGTPWWTLSPLASGSDTETVLEVQSAPEVRGSEDLLSMLFVNLRAHVTTGGRARSWSRVPAPGCAYSSGSRRTRSPRPSWNPERSPSVDRWASSRVRCTRDWCSPATVTTRCRAWSSSPNRISRVIASLLRKAARHRSSVVTRSTHWH